MLRVTVSRPPERRALCFDLESRPSAFWYDRPTAEITAFGWKWRDEPDVHALMLTSGGRFQKDDGRTLPKAAAYERFASLLAQAGVVYGHNVRDFDLPLLQAGLIRQRLPLLPPLLVTDTLRHFPKRRDMAADLDSLVDLFDLATERAKEKKHMSKTRWERANELRPEGIAAARARVTSDVILQEQLRDRLVELGYLGLPRIWRPGR